jgi:CBS domain-containing protein
MNVSEIMTENPKCCSPDTSLQDVAKLMIDNDCGEIPVLDEQGRPVGVVTDRDIACRCVAEGKDPRQTTAREAMSEPVATVRADESLESCCRLMEGNQIHRVPVVDESGACCGIVAMADVARQDEEADLAVGVMRNVSKPTEAASRTGCC